MIDYLACVPIVLLLITGTLLLALHRVLPGITSVWVAASALGLSLASNVALLWSLRAGPLSVVLYQWSPVEGASVNLGIRADNLSFLLASLALVVGVVVMLFLASSQRRHDDRSSSDGPSESVEARPGAEASIEPVDSPVPNTSRWKSGDSDPQTLLCAWVLNLVAVVLALLYAGNLLVVYLAWTAVGLCVFAARVAETNTADARSSAHRFLIVDLSIGYFILIGAALTQHETGTLLLLPSAKSESGLTLALMLMAIAALARTMQYPFSQLFLVVEHRQPSLNALVQCLVCAISGSYLLLRIVAAVGVGINPLGVGLIVLGLATTAYGLVAVLRESTPAGLASRATVVELGTAVAAFGVGTYAAIATGILMIVCHVVIRVALSIVLEAGAGRTTAPEGGEESVGNGSGAPSASVARDLVVALGVASLAGLPPFGGFWGRWMLAGVALAQGNLLLLALPVVSLMVLAWRLLNTLDGVLALTRVRTIGGVDRGLSYFSGVLVPGGLLALAAGLPSAVLALLVQPAAQAALTSDESLVTLALTAGHSPIDGWAAVCTLGIFLVALWVIYRLGLMPLTLQGKLKLTQPQPLSLGHVGLERVASAARLWLSGLAVTGWLLEPERLGQRALGAVVVLGRVLGVVVEEIEDRHFVPAMLLAVVMALFVLMG